jgi:hypothetical protein
MMNNLGRYSFLWHARCMGVRRETNQYYEQPIRIHLRSFNALGRKRPWRPRDFGICSLYSRCRLLDLAVRADSSRNLGAWPRAVRSLPYDHDPASSRKLIRLDGLKRSNLFERGTVRCASWLVWYAGQRSFTDIALVRRKGFNLSVGASSRAPQCVRADSGTNSGSLSVMAVYPYEPTSASLFTSCDAGTVEPRNINH